MNIDRKAHAGSRAGSSSAKSLLRRRFCQIPLRACFVMLMVIALACFFLYRDFGDGGKLFEASKSALPMFAGRFSSLASQTSKELTSAFARNAKSLQQIGYKTKDLPEKLTSIPFHEVPVEWTREAVAALRESQRLGGDSSSALGKAGLRGEEQPSSGATQPRCPSDAKLLFFEWIDQEGLGGNMLYLASALAEAFATERTLVPVNFPPGLGYNIPASLCPGNALFSCFLKQIAGCSAGEADVKAAGPSWLSRLQINPYSKSQRARAGAQLRNYIKEDHSGERARWNHPLVSNAALFACPKRFRLRFAEHFAAVGGSPSGSEGEAEMLCAQWWSATVSSFVFRIKDNLEAQFRTTLGRVSKRWSNGEEPFIGFHVRHGDTVDDPVDIAISGSPMQAQYNWLVFWAAAAALSGQEEKVRNEGGALGNGKEPAYRSAFVATDDRTFGDVPMNPDAQGNVVGSELHLIFPPSLAYESSLNNALLHTSRHVSASFAEGPLDMYYFAVPSAWIGEQGLHPGDGRLSVAGFQAGGMRRLPNLRGQENFDFAAAQPPADDNESFGMQEDAKGWNTAAAAIQDIWLMTKTSKQIVSQSSNFGFFIALASLGKTYVRGAKPGDVSCFLARAETDSRSTKLTQKSNAQGSVPLYLDAEQIRDEVYKMVCISYLFLEEWSFAKLSVLLGGGGGSLRGASTVVKYDGRYSLPRYDLPAVDKIFTRL